MKALKRTLKIIAVTLAVILTLIVLYILVDLFVGAFFMGRNVDFYKDVEEVGVSVNIGTDDGGVTTFTTDGDFRILVLSDTHIGGGILSGDEDAFALRAIEKIVRAEKPHLVALTGDIVYTTFWQTGNKDNKKSLEMIANLFESLKVYWAPIFGNHDSEDAKYTRKQMGEYLESDSLKYCLFDIGDTEGVGNYVINVAKTSGEITQSLIFMDTHAYPDEENDSYEYDNIHTAQIDWYEKQVEAQNEKNDALGASKPKSILFIHIPFEEYADALESGSIVYGSKREKIWYGINYGMFDKVKQMGQTQAVFCGHDHTNNYAASYEGVQLSYSMSIDYLAYMYTKFYNPARGGTRITVKTDGSFKSELVFLGDID